jgi:thiol-disulfide isomerase/thioredoxin
VLTILGVLVFMYVMGVVRAPDLPDQAPTFTARTLSGATFDLASLKGQAVVLNFWATWCGPCRFEVPAVSRFAARHPDIAVVGVVSPEPLAQVRRAVGELEIDYPVVLGSPEILAAYAITTFPTTIFVDSEGRVSNAHVGAMLDPQLELAALSL